MRFKVGPLLILNPDETTPLVYLDSDAVQVTEKVTFNSFRELRVNHPLIHDDGRDYSRYIRPGMKMFWYTTTEGDSCLYVIDGAVKYDYDANTVDFTAHEAAAELQDLPPVWVDPVVADNFQDARIGQQWTTTTNGGQITEGKGYLQLYASQGTQIVWGGASTYRSPCIAHTPLLEGNSFTLITRIIPMPTWNKSTPFGLAITNNNFEAFYRIGRHWSNDGNHYVRTDYRNPGGTETQVQSDEYKDLSVMAATWFMLEVDADGKATTSWSPDGVSWTSHTTTQLTWTPTRAGVFIRNWSPYYNSVKVRATTFKYIPWRGRLVDVTDEYLTNLTGGRFTATGTPSGLQARLGGLQDPYSIIMKVCEDNGLQASFRYRYDADDGGIKRELLLTSVDDTVRGVLRLGEDIAGLEVTIDESSVASAAAPRLTALNDAEKLIPVLQEYRELQVTRGASIPSQVYTDSQNRQVYGPNVSAPYGKTGGVYVVVAEDSDAEYRRIITPGVPDEARVVYVDVSQADHPLNLYWDLAGKLDEARTRKITLTFDYIEKSPDAAEFRYRVGDLLRIILPGEDEAAEFRVQTTEKNPHEPAALKMELGEEPIKFTRIGGR